MSGIILLDKPKGKSSFYLVKVLRGITKVKKIGHAGTLDPLATGVMVMLVGKEYTKLSDTFLHHDKEYEATIKLSSATTTYDSEGDITDTSDVIPSLKQVQDAIQTFQGKYSQVPPMYSAKKVNGKKLYEIARKGVIIEREAQEVEVQTTLVEYSYPLLKLKISCSKGTYIRTIAHDLGLKLKTYGHITELKRTRSGPYKLDECASLTNLDFKSLKFHQV